jgi:hypothetical protein
MFVQSEKFALEHEGRIGDVAVYGQEPNYTTWRLCKMNLAVRGIDAEIKLNSEGSFHKDELRDLKADYVLANPPFIISDWAATGYAKTYAGYSACRLSATPLRLDSTHRGSPCADRNGRRGSREWGPISADPTPNKNFR